jgi:uncharacterized protein (DUF885 family)
MRVEEVVRPYFDRLMELRPVDATYTGLHEHDGRLPEGSQAEAEEEIRLHERLDSELAGLPTDELDLEVARYFSRLSLFQARELRLWESMADAPDQIGTGIFLLFAREFAPLEDRLQSIAARLEQIPGYLQRSRGRLRTPVRLWNQIALQSAAQLPGLIDTVVAAAGPPQRARLDAVALAAKSAIADFMGWLEREVIPNSRSNHAVGEGRFEELVRLRRLPDPPERILELGRKYLAEVKESRRSLVAAEWPGRSLAEVESAIRGRHATDFAAALNEYRDHIARAREFVVERGLATLPAGERLHVMETPAYLRHVIPFAAYEPAAFFDADQLGIYIVTPPAGDAELGEHSRASILNTSVHEAYPGHHLQFVSANSTRSIVRLLSSFQAHEFTEGWAHYCEQLMFEEGFSAGPEVRFIQLTDLIWRACRIVIDVELSSGRMDFEQAVAMLVDEAGMRRPQAEAEVKRYTFTPGYQLSYLYGKHLLLQLRESERRRLGAAFDLRGFHDRLLYAGALPAALWKQLFAGGSGAAAPPP